MTPAVALSDDVVVGKPLVRPVLDDRAFDDPEAVRRRSHGTGPSSGSAAWRAPGPSAALAP